MSKFIILDGRQIGTQYPPYVIAEMSATHNSNLSNAFKIIRMAKNACVHAIKIIRPGFGISLKFKLDIIGKRVETNVIVGTAVDWIFFK
jgi:sialic acid synthase SpsE